MSAELSRQQIAELPEINVAVVFLRKMEEFFLQYRDPDTENGATGLFGAFGGQVEDERDGGDALRAIARETSEEVAYGESLANCEPLVLREDEFRELGSVHVISDRDGEPVFANVKVFETFLAERLPLVALKGQLVKMRSGDLSKAKAKKDLTPATEAAIERFYGIT